MRAAAIALSGLLAAGGVTAAVPSGPVPPTHPARVVSINLCTDQLALLLAAPGQLVSVSSLSQDPRQSVLAGVAARLPANHARAEEVYLLHPDLVLASDFTAKPTLDMLRRLGIPVAVFPAANSLAEAEAAITQMGDVLGRQQAATAMAGKFAAGLADLRADAARGRHPSVVLYEANGYVSGSRTLAGDILTVAGFRNRADDAGLAHGGMLPLEELVMLTPDAIIRPAPPPGAARADEVTTHPALRRIAPAMAALPRTGPDWTCATPAVLDAARGLARARHALAGGR